MMDCPGSNAIPSLVSADFRDCFCDMCGRMYRLDRYGTVRRHPHNYERFLAHMAWVVEQVFSRETFPGGGRA